MNSAKTALGLLAGIATGALIGILFAPEKGCVTRKKITNKYDDLMDKAHTKMNDMADTFNEKIEDAKNSTSELLANAQHKFDDVKNDLKS